MSGVGLHVVRHKRRLPKLVEGTVRQCERHFLLAVHRVSGLAQLEVEVIVEHWHLEEALIFLSLKSLRFCALLFWLLIWVHHSVLFLLLPCRLRRKGCLNDRRPQCVAAANVALAVAVRLACVQVYLVVGRVVEAIVVEKW